MNEFILVDSIFFILQKRKQNSKVFGDLSEATSLMGFPGGSVGKESPCNAGDVGLIPGSGKSAGEGKGFLGFPGGSAGKDSACNAEDPGSIPGLGRSPWRRK